MLLLPAVFRLVDDGGDSLSLAGDGSNGKCVMYARMATLEQVRWTLPVCVWWWGVGNLSPVKKSARG
jgi:hypothetical protein